MKHFIVTVLLFALVETLAFAQPDVLVENLAFAQQPDFNSSERQVQRQKMREQETIHQQDAAKKAEQERMVLTNELCPQSEDRYWALKRSQDQNSSDEEIRKSWSKTYMGQYCKSNGFKE